jgi:hypothetical protein
MHGACLVAIPAKPDLADVQAVQQHGALVRVVEALHQLDDGGPAPGFQTGLWQCTRPAAGLVCMTCALSTKCLLELMAGLGDGMAEGTSARSGKQHADGVRKRFWESVACRLVAEVRSCRLHASKGQNPRTCRCRSRPRARPCSRRGCRWRSRGRSPAQGARGTQSRRGAARCGPPGPPASPCPPRRRSPASCAVPNKAGVSACKIVTPLAMCSSS